MRVELDSRLLLASSPPRSAGTFRFFLLAPSISYSFVFALLHLHGRTNLSKPFRLLLFLPRFPSNGWDKRGETKKGMARQEIKRGKKEEDRIEREKRMYGGGLKVNVEPGSTAITDCYTYRCLVRQHLPSHPLLLIFEQANQVQPNLSSWQDTSVRTSSGPPQSTNSIAVHVAPVITLQRRYYEYRPRTFSVRTNQRFLYTLPSSLLFFPFRFQGWKKRGWVGRGVTSFRKKEREETVVPWKTTTIPIRTSVDFLLTAGDESGPFSLQTGYLPRNMWRGIAILGRARRKNRDRIDILFYKIISLFLIVTI